jgi:aryl-alcohol dehydrogenase-like predicted oxidoreductase
MITPVGYGSWAIGGSGWEYAWGPQRDDDSIEAIRRSLELGVNWIDAAAVYGLGHSEEVVVRALEGWKGQRPYVFTKCGLIGDLQGRLSRKLSAASVRKECEDSLRRLRTDVIDLYQVHWPPEKDAELEEGLAMLAALKKEGKVRWIGVSNFDVSQMKHCQSHYSHNLPPAALFAHSTRNRGRYLAVLRAGRGRGDRIRAYGLGAPHGRNDGRARSKPPCRRLAKTQPRIQ